MRSCAREPARPSSRSQPNVMLAVFSDVDETIIHGKSLLTFAQELAAATGNAEEVNAALEKVARMLRDGTPRAAANQAYYQLLLAGRPLAAVAAVAQRWFRRYAAEPQFFCGDV